jgi:hypothetical protein
VVFKREFRVVGNLPRSYLCRRVASKGILWHETHFSCM